MSDWSQYFPDARRAWGSGLPGSWGPGTGYYNARGTKDAPADLQTWDLQGSVGFFGRQANDWQLGAGLSAYQHPDSSLFWIYVRRAGQGYAYEHLAIDGRTGTVTVGPHAGRYQNDATLMVRDGGNSGVTRLRVQAGGGQAQAPLQEWLDAGGQPLARIQPDGRMEVLVGGQWRKVALE